MTTTQNTGKSEVRFRVSVTNADGTTSEGTASEADALRTLRTAIRRGYRVETTRQGGAVIVRDVLNGSIVPRKHTVTLKPVTSCGTLTDTNRADLGIIERRGGLRRPAQLNPATGRIDAGLNSIPPVAAKRLVERGLVTVDGTSVAVSLTARLAMLAQDHRTTTSEPAGYAYPLDLAFRDSLRTGRPVTLTTYNGGAGLNKPGRRAGKVYDGSSVASCSCRHWSYPAEDRDNARRKAHEHRQEATAAMLRTLDAAA